MSALLIVLFGGSTGGLLPLYALSVFAAFTFSQAGMVRHWLRERGTGWLTKATVNGVGATVTGVVALVAAVTNFVDPDHPIIPGTPIGWGAWLGVVIVPLFFAIFRAIRRHYADGDRVIKSMPEQPGRPHKNLYVVPVAHLNPPAAQ